MPNSISLDTRSSTAERRYLRFSRTRRCTRRRCSTCGIGFPSTRKKRPPGTGRGPAAPRRGRRGWASPRGPAPAQEWVDAPPGPATLGIAREDMPFGWDNEHPDLRVAVEPFSIERHDVTNARFMDFVEAGSYEEPQWWTADDWQWIQSEQRRYPLFWERHNGSWHWRGMFGLIPLPPAWPAYVSLAEGSAFARWQGTRLPTEAEFQRAAYGSPSGERTHPWGNAAPA